MPRAILKKSARHLSYLLPVLLATGCSQTAHKDVLNPVARSKFSVFTRNHSPSHHRFAHATESKDHQTVWDRMLSLYALPEMDNARIDREVSLYLKNPEYLKRIQQRAEPYLYFILNEIEAKNIPGELALLPVVESAFRPDAISPARASGLWQFIPPTGRLYGLEQNSWYDGRRDVIESTQAATTFLKQLSEEFNNDWLLALASYNAGTGNIKHAIDKNASSGRPTDFWSLKLNSETSAYVPRLLAVAKIFANSDKYNLDLHEIANEPYFETIDVKSQIDLTKAAELAQVPVEDFLKLNPAFNRWSTAPNGPHRLLVPVDKADAFREKLAELPQNERIKWEHHTVKKRETLTNIAKKHHTTVKHILDVNHLDSQKVAQGETLLIPVSYQLIKGQEKIQLASLGSSLPSRTQAYTVKNGDTVWSICRRFSVSKRDLLRWNKLSSKSILKPGQKLTIRKSGGKVPTTASNSKKVHYTVKPGDTLAQISKKFNVDVTDLRKWNNVPRNRSDIKPGLKLIITVDADQSSS